MGQTSGGINMTTPIFRNLQGAHGAGGVHRGHPSKGGGERHRRLLEDAQAEGDKGRAQEDPSQNRRETHGCNAQEEARVVALTAVKLARNNDWHRQTGGIRTILTNKGTLYSA